MMDLEERLVSQVMVEKYLKDNYGIDPKDMTGKEVIDRIFGGYNNEYQSEVRIINDCWSPKTTPLQRLNRFWAYPLTFLCMPYQYIKRGRCGWSDKTKFGRWVLRVNGYSNTK